MRQLWLSVVCQFHTCVLLILTLFEVSGEGSSRGPGYTVEPHHCNFDQDCDQGLGHTCIMLYQGCQMGTCMCDPLNYTTDNMGRCRPSKVGGEECTAEDKCPDRMVCLRGKCACVSGTMTSDRLFCKEDNYRMLGESCRHNKDICYHMSSRGYSDSEDVLCSSRGTCVCRKGFKHEGNSCKTWNIGEFGCKISHHCDGGALCLGGQCRCPNHYMAVAGNTKCASKTALVDLGYMSRCNEINEERYCKAGLVCQRCGEDYKNIFTCVRFTLTSQLQGSSPLTGSAQSTIRPLLYVLLVCVTSSLAINRLQMAAR